MSSNIRVKLDLLSLRFRKLSLAMFAPGLRRALRSGVAPAADHYKALHRLSPALVIDVGANRGQFALISRYMWPNALIRSFEPLAKPAAICRNVMAGDDKFELHQVAIGSEKRTIGINVTNKDDSSSILPLGDFQRDTYNLSVNETIEVPMAPLSDFVGNSMYSSDVLLKIDAQGYELEVLRGSEALHRHIDFIYLEVSFIELYNGQPLVTEIVRYLAERAFCLIGVYNVSENGAGLQIQADMLFRQSNSAKMMGQR